MVTFARTVATSSRALTGLRQTITLAVATSLGAILIGITYWRMHPSFMRQAFTANAVVMACGFLLIGYQLTGYFLPVL